MGLKRRSLQVKLREVLLSTFCMSFILTSVWINIELSTNLDRNHDMEQRDRVHVFPGVEDEPAHHRQRRQVTTLADWVVPSDPYPVVLGIPAGGCVNSNALTEYANATCVVNCKSCSGLFSDIQAGRGDLACTGKVIVLSAKMSVGYHVTAWLSQLPDVVHRYTNIPSDTTVDYAVCPGQVLANSESGFYMEPYTDPSSTQSTYLLHCEGCLSTAVYADIMFGSLFLDLPTMIFPYIQKSPQKFIVTLKNPTDRLIAEYFYPYSQAGKDLNDYGGQVLHEKMVNAINDIKTCMASIGPTACVYGVDSGDTMVSDQATRNLIYDGCYVTRLKQLYREINPKHVHVLQSEEFYADNVNTMEGVFQFVGIDSGGSAPEATAAVSKPFLAETVQLLDEFFYPFNVALYQTLGDSKWQSYSNVRSA